MNGTTSGAPGEVSTGNIKWSHAEVGAIYGGVLSTAGDLVFYTTLDAANTFHALDVSNPVNGDVKEVWHANLECPSTGNPITWRGSVDGKQRVAVYSGVGAMVGGMRGFTPGVAGKPCTSSNGGVVHVYVLP